MRYLLFIGIVVFGSLNSVAQKAVDFNCIVNHWIQGKIEEDGSIAHADQGRGGWDNLQLNANHTVTFNTGFMCGFGSSKSGKWCINKKKLNHYFSVHTKKGISKRKCCGDNKRNKNV
jgi:hypothetical protein